VIGCISPVHISNLGAEVLEIPRPSLYPLKGYPVGFGLGLGELLIGIVAPSFLPLGDLIFPELLIPEKERHTHESMREIPVNREIGRKGESVGTITHVDILGLTLTIGMSYEIEPERAVRRDRRSDLFTGFSSVSPERYLGPDRKITPMVSAPWGVAPRYGFSKAPKSQDKDPIVGIG
jgi:hypothetical protein